MSGGTPAPGEGPPRPRHWPARLLDFVTSPSALLQATGFLALVAVGVGSAWLLPPSNVVGDLPGDESLHTLSTVSIKASRDYTIPDPDATEALRNEAAGQVRSVYDFDAEAGKRAAARIDSAFSLAREAQETALAAAAAQKPKTKAKPKKGEVVETDDDVALAAAQLFYGDFIKQLQAVIDPADYKDLATRRFSKELQLAVTMLVGGTMHDEIAPSRELLYAERANGITVRALEDGAVTKERDLRDVEPITDLAAVRLDLSRLSQSLPEIPGSNSGVARAALGLSAAQDPDVRRIAALVAARIVAPNIAYNAGETESRKIAADHEVKPVVLPYARGEKIIGEGERIEKRHLLVFHYIREKARAMDSFQIRLGATLFTVLLVVSAFSLARRTLRRFRPSKRDLVFLAATLLGNLAALRGAQTLIEQLRTRPVWLTNEVLSLALPLAGGAMLVRMLRSGESVVVFALVFAPLTALQFNSYVPAAVGLLSSLVAANRLGGKGGRGALPSAAFEAALGAAISMSAIAMLGGRTVQEMEPLVAASVVGAGILSPLGAILVAPLVEFFFGYVSESRLSSLANLNHPVLKELIIKAPGTYHHSLIVGALAESGARAIGAHPMLSRVGGYYHDLGKMEAPLLFAENQKNENRLERLPPEEAATVVRKHVEDGVRRAREAHLPRVVVECIAQHHGTGEAGHFLNRATADAELARAPLPLAAGFRYAGPRPRSREAALVLLADAVEAATRGLSDAPAELMDRLNALVPSVVHRIISEGQLDDCDLTLAEVRVASTAFSATLAEMRQLSRIDVLPTGRISAPPVSAPPPLEESTTAADGTLRVIR